MIYTSKRMTVAACPEGGFMVYTAAEENDAFQRNAQLIPIAGFADLKEALDFIERKMTAATEASRG